MKNTVQLYEFMPYGAPELLESRQRHMGQALILTCASFLLLYALIGSLAPLMRVPDAAPTMPTVEIITDLGIRIDQPPPPPVPPDTPVSRRDPEVGIPVPTPNVPDVPIEPVPPAPTGATTTGSIGSVIAPGVGPATSTGEVLPSPNTPVYVEQLPAVVKAVKPIYPGIAKDAGVEGLVMVKVLVGKDGRVLDALLVDKFQVPMLNESALAAARQWVFTPGLDGGRPVSCWTVIPFRFQLH